MNRRALSIAAAALVALLATGCQSAPVAESKEIEIHIKAGGTYLWNDEPVTLEDLNRRLNAEAAKKHQPVIIVSADSDADFASVSAVFATVQRLDLTKVGVVGGS